MNVFEDIRLTHQVEYTNSVRGDIVDDVGILLSAVDALVEVARWAKRGDLHVGLERALNALPPELKEALK